MFLVLSRKRLFNFVVLVVIVVVFLVFGFVYLSTTTYVAKEPRLIPVYNVETTEKVIAFTFDAAWGADKTEDILNILDSYDVSATFFLVGFWVAKYPDMVKEIDERGMLIGNHSNNHLNMTVIDRANMELEIDRVNLEIKELTGKEPIFFRAPYGAYNNELIKCVTDNGMVPIQWDVDSLDWKGLRAKEIKGRVLDKVKCGSIVLFHNNSDNITEALPIILVELISQGYSFKTLDELVLTENYYVDNQGVQHAN